MSEWVRAWHRYRRQNRFLLGVFFFVLILVLAAAYLSHRTQVESPQDLTNRLLLFVLWYLDISLILVLLFILVRNLVRLALERRSGVLGSRFRTRLVITYVTLTIIPVVFIFLIATNLLQRSIERWFSAPVENVLRSGFAVTEQLREVIVQRLERQALQAALELEKDATSERLPRLHALLGTDLLALYRQEELVQAVTDARRIPTSLPALRWDRTRPVGHRAERWRGGLLVRAWHPVDESLMVVVGDMVPRDLLLDLETTAAAHATFQEMKLERGTVTSTTILVFLAITLLLLFGTVWVGLFLSRRFTEPLLAVAAATQRVAEGDQLEEVASPATDEVAVLVDSFNAMVRRVRSTEHEIRASNQELATLLATIPTGVLSLSADGGRFRPNLAAARLIGEPEWAGDWIALDELDGPGLEPLFAHLVRENAQPSTQLDLEVSGAYRKVDVTVEDLPEGGQVVALDDLTQLVRAQRQAAWSEVARRIAHEIKNPLTPIRLAAERIQRRAQQGDDDLQAVVTSGTDAIIAHVSGLKELVDSFHQYARMPVVSPKPVLVSRLIKEVVALYEHLRDDVTIGLASEAEEIEALVDAALLRQALVNLLDNAIEAMSQSGGTVDVRSRADGHDLVIEIHDSGPGLPTEDLGRLLQPFFSTKGRGSGMGLALVNRIVTDHGGALELANRETAGAIARVTLPGTVTRAEMQSRSEQPRARG